LRRNFRFGAAVSTSLSAPELADFAHRVEGHGYDVLLIPDHLQDQLAPLPALAMVASATARLRLGTFVLNNDLRQPAVLAQELATLDHLSGGRLEIGLGAGWNAPEYRSAGIPFAPHAERLARLGETVRVLRGLFDESPFTFEGRYYQIHGLDGRPKPVQRPSPPFLIGGGGQCSLEFAAREADIVGLAPRFSRRGLADIRSALAPATEEKVAWIRRAVGSDRPLPELNTYPAIARVAVTETAGARAGELAERLSGEYRTTLTGADLLESPHVFFGTIDQLAEKCLALRERFGISYIMAGVGALAFAPVVERLAGH
jgi:probable F420-dependent oxidoreductase